MVSGAWLRYVDAFGEGFAQPDHFILLADRLVIVECKLTWVATAREQLCGLYGPLLRAMFPLPQVRVHVFKNWPRDASGVRPTLVRDLAALTPMEEPYQWHFL